MGMTLWNINEQLKILEEYMVDSETGELLSEEEFAKRFDEIQMALSDKIENTLCFSKSLDAEVEAFKNEEREMAKRRKVKENLSERLKQNVDRYIRCQFMNDQNEVDEIALNKYKFETPKVKLSYRKSQVVNVFDESKIPKEFIKEVIDTKVDKTELKKYLKDHECDGAKLDTNINMQVK